MAKVTRVFPYVNGRQIFTVPGGYGSSVIYHCWAGGGGAGGDSNNQLGGNGSAGVYTTGQVFLSKGDQIEVVVGGGGDEGRAIDSNKKLFSMTLRGSDSISTGAWGYVNDPTQAVYPEYNSWPTPRTNSSWNSFMNAWAVSDIPNSKEGGEEEFRQSIYFPESGSYNIRMAADNKMTVYFRGNFLAQVDNNFNGSVKTESISVPEAGTYELRYLLINSPSPGTNNPAGAAIVITKDQPSYMGSNGPNPVRGVIWSTRFGRDLTVTNRVPLYHAPLVPFYQPQRDNYDWSGFNDDKGLVFISVNSVWGDDDIAKLNLSFDKVIVLNYPVTIRGWGRVEQSISTGYYTFKRGQTWKQAQYSWSGNQLGTWETGAVYPNGVGAAPNLNIAGAIDHGSGTPSCWRERSFSNGKKTYTENAPFANWELPVPGADELYIVGFDDGQYFTSSNQRGSSDLTWQVNSLFSQVYAGGSGGYSVLNVNNTGLNYYGGYGGQIGDGKVSGGGGGGGGASLILQRTTRGTSLLTVAGGGAGGGGAGPNQFGDNGRNNHEPYVPQTNATAGQAGANSADSGGGGGGGGGGQYGGKGGAGAIEGVGSRGDGGWQGGSQVTATGLEIPKADFVMIGRGGDGGPGGGGGGAGDLLVGQTKLLRTQHIQVGGRGEDKFEGGVSAIWYSDTDYIAAGPGGKGGDPGSQFAKNGNGQAGGCKNTETNTNLWGGSGGGGGTRTIKSTASGGPGKTWAKKPSSVISYSSSGGNSAGSTTYAPGGGGGAGGPGNAGNGTVTGTVPGSSTTTYNSQNPNWGPNPGNIDIGGYFTPTNPYLVQFPSNASRTTRTSGGDTYAVTSYSFYLNLPKNTNGYWIQGGASQADIQYCVISHPDFVADLFLNMAIKGNGRYNSVSTTLNFKSPTAPDSPIMRGEPTDYPWYKFTVTSERRIPTQWLTECFALAVFDANVSSSQPSGPVTPASTSGVQWITINSILNPSNNIKTGWVYQPGVSTNPVAKGGNGGNGGPGRNVPLGPTGKTYLLGGGGGAAAGYYNPGVQFAGLGSAGGGDGATGSDPAIQWSVPGTYSFTVPNGVRSIRVKAVGGGGAGGAGGQFGNGGGGSGGFTDDTSVSVLPGQPVTVVVGRGGANGPGGDTLIQFTFQTIVLGGGRQASAYTGGFGGSPNGSQGEQGKLGDSTSYFSGSGASSPFGEGGRGVSVSSKAQTPGNGQTGAGGGGGWSNSTGTVNGGLGGAGFVRLEWDNVDSTQARPNSGSGGGGGYDGGGGAGGTGLVAIGYAGDPLFSFTGESFLIQQNGYTIHECYSSGDLVYNVPETQGRFESGGNENPAGQGVNGYIAGTAAGGVGKTETNVYPVPFTQGYTGFLNDYSVWNLDLRSTTFERTYYVYVPETASYDFEAAADNGGQVYVDDGLVINMTPYDRDEGKYWSQNISRNTKKLTTGQHKIYINAVNIGSNGAFGMKIVKTGTDNPLLFNSRQPPIAGGSPQGGNGQVILVFQGGEGTAQVKVNNAWKKLIGQWVKVSGTWKIITDSSVKIAGSWESLFGATPFSVSVDTANFGGPSTPTVTTPVTLPPPKPPPPPPDPGPTPPYIQPQPASDWFIVYNQFPDCVPKWSQFLRDKGIWEDASEINGCKAPVTTKRFTSDFFSHGGTHSMLWSVDDDMAFRLEDSTGKVLFTKNSSNNQGSPTSIAIGVLPTGTIYVFGAVGNNNVSGKNLAGLAVELKDSTGSTVWSTLNVL